MRRKYESLVPNFLSLISFFLFIPHAQTKRPSSELQVLALQCPEAMYFPCSRRSLGGIGYQVMTLKIYRVMIRIQSLQWQGKPDSAHEISTRFWIGSRALPWVSRLLWIDHWCMSVQLSQQSPVHPQSFLRLFDCLAPPRNPLYTADMHKRSNNPDVISKS